MYSGKSVRPRKNPWGSPILTGYFCEDFPPRTIWSCLLLKKGKIRPNIWPEIPKYLTLWKRPACQTLSKALGKSNATARVAPDLLKALAILSDTILRRFAAVWEDLKTYSKSEKRSHSSLWSTSLLFTSFSNLFVVNKPIIYKVFKDFTHHKKEA